MGDIAAVTFSHLLIAFSLLFLHPHARVSPTSTADKVEVCDNRVAVCRDHANGICRRQKCKYYHIPIIVPPAPVMAAIHHQHGDPPTPPLEGDYYQTEQPHQQHQMIVLDGGEEEEGAEGQRQGPDAIEGVCTNSVTTSEFSLLNVVVSPVVGITPAGVIATDTTWSASKTQSGYFR